MKSNIIIGVCLWLIVHAYGSAQVNPPAGEDTIKWQGQLSAWGNVNPKNNSAIILGGRYLPQINYELGLPNDQLFDIEASANIFGSAGLKNFSEQSSGKIKPYRLWARYSTHQFEMRAGLQKINFGSATMLRPLMWFDQLDPRDPLKLTDGVWGLLTRYYFLNNANIWLWGLWRNHNTKGWEVMRTYKNTPEFGGRVQHPIPSGEMALSFHHREVYTFLNQSIPFSTIHSPENRLGFDVKMDRIIGCWVEASWINKTEEVGMFNHQEIINLGADYTFAVGNGLTIIYEHLIAAYDFKPFAFAQPINFSLINFSYPVGLFDNISAIVYYDWSAKNTYSFLNWQKQFNNLSLYVMGYLNPKEYNIPAQETNENLFSGRGVQFMVVYNY